MNSTDDEQTDELRRFFDRHIRPLHGRLDLDLRGRSEGSYFRRRCGLPPERSDFHIPLGEPEEIARTLDARWKDTPLAGMGKKLIRLSQLFENESQGGDVSQYIYEMF